MSTVHDQRTGSVPPRADEIPTEVVRLRYPGRWVTACVLVLLGVLLVQQLIVNKRFQWDVFWQYLFSPQILVGLQRTLILTVIAMAIGIVLGTLLAIMRLSRNPVMRTASGLYIWFFRGTPLLVQLIFWYNLAALYPSLVVGIPSGPGIDLGATNLVISTWGAAILGLGLNEAAYMAEIIRGGLLSVDRGQVQAAESIGMTDSLVLRRIVLPQALRVIVPPTGNQVVGMLKYTSLVSVIALPELLYSAQLIYTQNFQPIPLLLVACFWYLLVTSLLTIGQGFLERHYGRGFKRTDASTPGRWNRLQARLKTKESMGR